MKHILIEVDYSTRFGVVRAVRAANGQAFQKFILEEVIYQFGYIKEVTTDQGF